MNNEVKYFPLDVDALRKGQTIEVKQVEEITGCSRSDYRVYPLKLLWLSGKIQRELRKRGRVLTLRTRDGALIVCDDADASLYNCKQGRSGIRRFRRAHFRNLAVDVAKLDEIQRKQHERTLLTQGRMLAAIVSSRVAMLPDPKKREIPALMSPEK